MGLIGKLQAETLIGAPAHKFHEVFWCRPHHISMRVIGAVPALSSSGATLSVR